MRIVSLLPSATELVCALGLREWLVGVTHECDFPAEVRGLPVVTKTLLPVGISSGEIDSAVREQLSSGRSLYALDHGALAALGPDLIITQTLCDVCAVSEGDVARALCQLPREARVLNLEPTRLVDVLQSLETVAEAVGEPELGRRARRGLEERIQRVTRAVEGAPKKRALVLEWLDPPFSAGHWVPEIVGLAGGVEPIGMAGERSVTLTWDDVRRARPEVLFISCCGFDISRSREDWPGALVELKKGELPCLENGEVYLLDGSAYLSRPGPRLVEALELMAHALHPDRVDRPANWITGISRIYTTSETGV